ncbi:hypothetical protein B0H14DRAFT_2562935 [Mycena olivaceomarginata]|nr:hypothetical protein B0H14DRAFT_2562935 [Mycena olivaceomarginata]
MSPSRSRVSCLKHWRLVQTPPLTSGAPSGTPSTSSSTPWIPPTFDRPVLALARFTSALSTATATSTTTAMPVGVTPPSFSFSASVSHAPVAPLMESRPMGNPPPAEKPAAAKKRRRPAKSKGPAATPVSAAAAPAPEGDENGTGVKHPATPAKRGWGRPRKDAAAPQPVMTEAVRTESARIHNEEQELRALRAEMLRCEKAIADRARGACTAGTSEIFIVARPVREARAVLYPDGTAVIQIPRGSQLGGAMDLDAAQAAADAALEQQLCGGPRTAQTVDPAALKTRAAKAKAEGKGKGKGKKRKADDTPAAAKALASNLQQRVPSTYDCGKGSRKGRGAAAQGQWLAQKVGDKSRSRREAAGSSGQRGKRRETAAAAGSGGAGQWLAQKVGDKSRTTDGREAAGSVGSGGQRGKRREAVGSGGKRWE